MTQEDLDHAYYEVARLLTASGAENEQVVQRLLLLFMAKLDSVETVRECIAAASTSSSTSHPAKAPASAGA